MIIVDLCRYKKTIRNRAIKLENGILKKMVAIPLLGEFYFIIEYFLLSFEISKAVKFFNSNLRVKLLKFTQYFILDFLHPTSLIKHHENKFSKKATQENH